MKIGLYGGTFDPIHNAHLLIAQYIKDELGLEKVVFIPASVPPHKKTFSASNLRYKMVEAAIADNPDFECSPIEIERKGKSFSYDTICGLKEFYQLGREQIFWIIGSDNLAEFHTWHKPDEIIKACNIVVFPRNKKCGDLKNTAVFEQILYLRAAPLLEISSSEIRNRVKDGLPIKYYVPDLVNEIIFEQKLYR